jgi:hypothetical protein
MRRYMYLVLALSTIALSACAGSKPVPLSLLMAQPGDNAAGSNS